MEESEELPEEAAMVREMRVPFEAEVVDLLDAPRDLSMEVTEEEVRFGWLSSLAR